MKNILLAIYILLMSPVLYAQTHIAKIETNYGTIKIMLYDSTPLHRDNFIKLVKRQYYDSLLFHRVIKDFVIQAGDPFSKHAKDGQLLGDSDLGYTVPAEIMPDRYYHKRGAVGAARDERPDKASSACQFYIVQGKVADDSAFIKARVRSGGYEITAKHKAVYRKEGGTPRLDARYTVFGEVTEGMDVVDRISEASTDKNDRPKKEVRILRVRMEK